MRVCCAGEVMIEMAALGQDNLYQRGVAGDSYNTAVYLARKGLQVDYLTRLGDDLDSGDILDRLANEGVGTTFVARIPKSQPGLYLISNDSIGERQFSYWRNQAPVRGLFDSPLKLPPLDAFYFTGITLAVTRSGAQGLRDLLHGLREQNCRIIFDPNFRPGLWDSLEQAQRHYRDIIPLCDLALPTLDDENLLWKIDSIEQCRDLYLQQGISELVVKGGDLTAHVFHKDEYIQRQARPVSAVDTTGAGDSFNAGYLASRLKGESIEESLFNAQELAAAVVQHRGAILPRN